MKAAAAERALKPRLLLLLLLLIGAGPVDLKLLKLFLPVFFELLEKDILVLQLLQIVRAGLAEEGKSS